MQNQQIYNKDNFLEQVDQFRVITSQNIDEDRKSEFSQYFTPAEIGRFMASLFQDFVKNVSLLVPALNLKTFAFLFVFREIKSLQSKPNDYE